MHAHKINIITLIKKSALNSVYLADLVIIVASTIVIRVLLR